MVDQRIVNFKSRKNRRIWSQLTDTVKALAKTAPTIRTEGNDIFTAQVVCVQEGPEHGGQVVTPDGVAEVDGVVVADIDRR